MERNTKVSRGALTILGAIYTPLGGFFVGIGIFLAAHFWGTENQMIGNIFILLGSPFLLLGILFLILVFRKKRRNDRLLNQGRFIWGEVINCEPNYNVRINGRCPYIVQVRYRDAAGVNHLFKSDSINLIGGPDLLGMRVKVYIEDDTYKHYYVDIEDGLPSYIEH